MSLNDVISFIKEKVNFKEHKYRLPLILFPLIIIAGYFIIKLFNVSTYNIISQKLKSTEFLNPELPEAKLSGKEVQTRREALENTYGHISEVSPFDSIDEEILLEKEDYDSIYKSQEDLNLSDNENSFKAKQNLKVKDEIFLNKSEDSLLTIIEEQEKKEKSLKAKNEAFEELQKVFSEAQIKGKKGILDTFNIDLLEKDEDSSFQKEEKKEDLLSQRKREFKKENSSYQETLEVKKSLNQSSSYFNTIKDDEDEPFFIRAIIDEDIKAQEQSRVRLRLLDAIEIDGKILKKGTYLYATFSGFSSQRVKGKVESIFIDDVLSKVNLSIYDMDGLEGLYVPQSSFREVAKDVLSGAVNSNVNIGSSSSNSFSSWAEKLAGQAYNNITSMMSKNIKKNKALLKYGTFVYLVNKSNTKK